MPVQKASTDPANQEANKPGASVQAVSENSNLNDYSSWDYPESNWNQAVSHTSQADPFCCRTEWQLSYHESREPEQQLVVRETPGSIVAFSKYDSLTRGEFFLPIESSWEYGCPLLGPDSLDILEDILTERPSHPQKKNSNRLILISGVIPESVFRKKLIKRFSPHFNCDLLRKTLLCNASLDGGIDGYLSRRSSSQRRSLRKQSKRAIAKGITFERHSPNNPQKAEEIYQRMLTVEAASWKGIEECGMTMQPSRDYYECMLRRLSFGGNGRVIFARYAESDIGYIFGGMADKIYRGQQFSFNDDWKAWSIGNLLQVEQIKWLCEEGAIRYDMGPFMDYKQHWVETHQIIESIRLKTP